MANHSISLNTLLCSVTVLSCVSVTSMSAAQAPPPALAPAPKNPGDLPVAPVAVNNSGKQTGTPVQAPTDARQAIRFEPEILNLGEMSAEVAKTGKI